MAQIDISDLPAYDPSKPITRVVVAQVGSDGATTAAVAPVRFIGPSGADGLVNALLLELDGAALKATIEYADEESVASNALDLSAQFPTKAAVSNAIGAEATRAGNAESSLASSLSREILRAGNAESGLQSSLNSVASSLASAKVSGTDANAPNGEYLKVDALVVSKDMKSVYCVQYSADGETSSIIATIGATPGKLPA